MKRPQKPTPSSSASLMTEMHRLPHFIALAEEGHYGKAAERLGMDQPTLSRSIIRLEEAVGAKLLLRTARAVTLTPAGLAFLKEARALVSQVQLSHHIARRAQAGETGTLRIGFTPTAMFWAVPKIMRVLRKRFPDIQLIMQEAQSYAHVDRLRNGELDAAFVNGDVLKRGEFEVQVLERTRNVAVVPSAWPVARMKKLRLRDLAELPLILVPRDKSPNTYHGTLSACRAAGFMPKIVPGDNTELLSRLGMVASNVGVMLASEYTQRLQVEGVSYVPLVDLPAYMEWELVLAWDARAMTPALRELANISKSISKAMGSARSRAPRAHRKPRAAPKDPPT